MRISSIEQFQQGIDSILNQQAKLNQTQLQLATGKKVLKPSDDPAVATQLLNLSSLKANNLQYDRNINTAQNELELQESVLASSGNVLQRVRELTIQANNATQGSETRAAIADEISNLADELLQLSNSKSPSGEYIFAGYNSRTPAFAKSGAGFVYQGDQGQRLLQVSEDTQLAVRDNGADVFQGMTTGDGRFLLETPASNTGDGLVKMSSTIDAISDNYTITFIQANPGEICCILLPARTPAQLKRALLQPEKPLILMAFQLRSKARLKMGTVMRSTAPFVKMSSSLYRRLRTPC